MKFAPLAETDTYQHLCGSLASGYLEAGPGTIEVPLWLYGNIVYLPVDYARMISDSAVDQNGWIDMMIGGGLTRDTIDNHLIPTLVDALNAEVIAYPTGAAADFVLTSLDAACDPIVEGCDTVVNGQGDCTAWTGEATDPPLTDTEIKCNLMLASALTPDVDTNNDGENDLVSMGIRVQAISVTVDN